MKGSSLHRAGLTREKMGLLLNLGFNNENKKTPKEQTNETYKAPKNKELDILWGGVQRGIQKVHNATKGSSQKSPAVYLVIGFIAGVIFMSVITFIVSVSTMAPKTVEEIENTNKKVNSVVVPPSDETTTPTTTTASDETVTQEKYIVKQGDTLNGIAYRFYGRYDEKKLKEIQTLNNLTNPEALSIGQELIIPVSSER